MSVPPIRRRDTVPLCPICGASIDVDWVDIRSMADPYAHPIPGLLQCARDPHHDVSEASSQFAMVEIARHGRRTTQVCPAYRLDAWRADGWFPTDLDRQTPTEAVEHRVWQLAKDTP